MSRERLEDLFAGGGFRGDVSEARLRSARRAELFEEVRPGDIISSDLINRILLQLVRLEARVQELEARPVPETPERQVEVVTNIEPTESQAVGQLLTLSGFFATPATANTVLLDQTPITDFVAANSGQLSFIVPASFNVPAGKTLGVKLTVENGLGKSIRDYVLKPPAQVAADNPEISAVEFINLRTGGVIGVGGMVKATGMTVRGRNFAEKATDNQVRIELRSGRTTLRFPKQGSLKITEKDSNTKQLIVALPTEAADFGRAVEAATAIAIVVRARDKEASHVIKEDRTPIDVRPDRDIVREPSRRVGRDDSILGFDRDALTPQPERDPFGPSPGSDPRFDRDFRSDAGRVSDRFGNIGGGNPSRRGRLD